MAKKLCLTIAFFAFLYYVDLLFFFTTPFVWANSLFWWTFTYFTFYFKWFIYLLALSCCMSAGIGLAAILQKSVTSILDYEFSKLSNRDILSSIPLGILLYYLATAIVVLMQLCCTSYYWQLCYLPIWLIPLSIYCAEINIHIDKLTIKSEVLAFCYAFNFFILYCALFYYIGPIKWTSWLFFDPTTIDYAETFSFLEVAFKILDRTMS